MCKVGERANEVLMNRQNEAIGLSSSYMESSDKWPSIKNHMNGKLCINSDTNHFRRKID